MSTLTATSRLDELAASIRQHHEAFCGHARLALEHVIACGEALAEARDLVPEGRWMTWMEANVGLNRATVQMYIRIATFRDELHAAKVTSVQAARDYLRDHDLIVELANRSRTLAPEVVMEIRRLSEQGVSQRRIAQEIGVAKVSVGRIQNGERHRQDEPSSKPRRSSVGITDFMIEGMARWLVATFPHRFPNMTDEVRHQAVAALNAALTGALT